MCSVSVDVVLKLFWFIGGSSITTLRKPCVRAKHHIDEKSAECFLILRDCTQSSRTQVMYRKWTTIRHGAMTQLTPMRLICISQMQCVLLYIVDGRNKEPRCNRCAIASATLCASGRRCTPTRTSSRCMLYGLAALRGVKLSYSSRVASKPKAHGGDLTASCNFA